MKILSRLISTMMGIGYSPIAPGTAGSLAAMLVWWFLPASPLLVHFIFILVLFLIGTWASSITEQDWIRCYGDDKGHDPQVVVIDEAVGVFIAVFVIPKSLYYAIAAFVLFRFFDIVKPFPINRSQKLSGGWGIMIDDVIAGIYSNILIQLYCVLDM
jgi:phosphatidylglycerophosphatase A